MFLDTVKGHLMPPAGFSPSMYKSDGDSNAPLPEKNTDLDLSRSDSGISFTKSSITSSPSQAMLIPS